MRSSLLRLVLLSLLLAGCSSAPAVPDWQMDAHDAAGRAVQAYLSGDDRVAQSEWQRAREQVARTGRPDLMARLELLRCAAQVASLQWDGCDAFEALRQDVDTGERAYADYLGGHIPPAWIPLLPEAQRAAAADIGAVSTVAQPLAQLVAAGAALRAGRATPQVLAVATETASAQGWRRPLLAWLLLRQHQARAAGDEALAEQLQRRIAVAQGGH